MWGLTTQAVVSHTRRILKKVVNQVGNLQKGVPRKEGISLSSVVTPHQTLTHQSLVARFTGRNVYPRLVQRMRSKYGGNLTSGSAQVFGNFHGLRGKVAFGFIAGFAFNQMQVPEDGAERVCSDIRNLFVKADCDVESCVIGLDNYELGCCLSAKNGAIVYEARLKNEVVDLDGDDISILDDTACPSRDDTACPSHDTEPLMRRPDATIHSSSVDVIPVCQKITDPTVIVHPKENMSSQVSQNQEVCKNLEAAVREIEESFDLISENETEIPPVEFSPLSFDPRSFMSISSSFSCDSYFEVTEEYFDSVPPIYFSIHSEVDIDCDSEASDIEVLEELDECQVEDDKALLRAALTQDTINALKIHPPEGATAIETMTAPCYDLAVKILTPTMNCEAQEAEITRQSPLSSTGVAASGLSVLGLPPHPNIVQVRGQFTERAPWLSWSRVVDNADVLPTRLGTGHNHVTVIVIKRYPCSLPVYLSSHTLSHHSGCLLLTQLLEVVLHLHDVGLTHRRLSSDDLMVGLDEEGDPLLVDCSRYKQIESKADVEQEMCAVSRVACEVLGIRGEHTAQLTDELPSALSRVIRALLYREVQRPSPRIILTALHLILWQLHHLQGQPKVMPGVLIMAAGLILTSRGQHSNNVTCTLQTLMLSRLTAADLHEALELLNGTFM